MTIIILTFSFFDSAFQSCDFYQCYFSEISSSNVSCNMLTTTSPVTSSLSSFIRGINKQFVLEYCLWLSLSLSNNSTFSFRPLTYYFKRFIIFSFSLRSFSNSSNFSDASLTYCVRSASFLLPLIFMDLASLLRSYVSDIFTYRVLRYSKTSEISCVVILHPQRHHHC